MTRSDAVSPELAAAVFARDRGCLAPRLGGSIHDCWGRDGIEHVKAEPRMGKRAEARLDRLVTLCEGHREPGMRAGYVWCTDRTNREAMREYLRSQPDPHDAHVDPVRGCLPCERVVREYVHGLRVS